MSRERAAQKTGNSSPPIVVNSIMPSQNFPFIQVNYFKGDGDNVSFFISELKTTAAMHHWNDTQIFQYAKSRVAGKAADFVQDAVTNSIITDFQSFESQLSNLFLNHHYDENYYLSQWNSLQLLAGESIQNFLYRLNSLAVKCYPENSGNPLFEKLKLNKFLSAIPAPTRTFVVRNYDGSLNSAVEKVNLFNTSIFDSNNHMNSQVNAMMPPPNNNQDACSSTLNMLSSKVDDLSKKIDSFKFNPPQQNKSKMHIHQKANAKPSFNSNFHNKHHFSSNQTNFRPKFKGRSNFYQQSHPYGRRNQYRPKDNYPYNNKNKSSHPCSCHCYKSKYVPHQCHSSCADARNLPCHSACAMNTNNHPLPSTSCCPHNASSCANMSNIHHPYNSHNFSNGPAISHNVPNQCTMLVPFNASDASHKNSSNVSFHPNG